jgi:hypothetical protein
VIRILPTQQDDSAHSADDMKLVRFKLPELNIIYFMQINFFLAKWPKICRVMINRVLEDVKEAKYLVVTLSSNLTWNTHICNITGKANKLLGFLRRHLKVRNETTKENAYKAIARSNLEYCSYMVWSPHTKKNKDELERIQRRAAHFVSGNVDTIYNTIVG